jgi:hypothetical protein
MVENEALVGLSAIDAHAANWNTAKVRGVSNLSNFLDFKRLLPLFRILSSSCELLGRSHSFAFSDGAFLWLSCRV